jgi:ADP-heptose:LPS heptosyltransferase
MGDVAMTVPVIKALSENYQNAEIILLTGRLFNPFFKDIPRLRIINPDLKGTHKGIIGMYKLYRHILSEYKPELFIDLHDVLRTKILRFFFRFSGIASHSIDKGRRDKRALTSKKNKDLRQLKHSVERYIEALAKADFNIDPSFKLKKQFEMSPEIRELIGSDLKKIGLAPFAKHPQKQYPLEKTSELIELLVSKGYELFIFGGGKHEADYAEQPAENYPRVTSLVNRFKLRDEIALMHHMDLMITMDSANMHMAALTDTKILSIWGATHPYAGFTPYIKKERSIIMQIEDLECRPCSVFGNKPCYKETLECLHGISPKKIAETCEQILG